MTTPEQRRRLAAGLMAAQYDRPTPQDTTVTERAGLLPLGTYANGMTGLAFPGFLADPVSGFIREATNPVPYLNRSEDEKRQTVETGFDVAGAAMVGGLAAPKPSNTVGSAGGKLAGEGRQGAAAGAAVNALGASERPSLINRMLSVFGKEPDYQPRVPGFPNMKVVPDFEPEIAYRGSKTSKNRFRDPSSRGPWASSDPDIASTYANPNYLQSTSPSIQPMEFRFKNPVEIDARGAAWDSVPTGNWFKRLSTDEIGDRLKNSGYDGVVFRNVRDAETWTDPSTPKSDVYHALKRGTVYSPLTGDLLYANGGRPGGAAGAALSSLDNANVPGIRAYHGSPHDFDRFDMSKIGTGEGAQAYGHGLYFAENEGVAKIYKRAGRNVSDAESQARHLLEKFKGDREAAAKFADKEARYWSPGIFNKGMPAEAARFNEASQMLKDKTWNDGRMYEVNIKANPEDFLDWDKPLSQQSEKVQQAFQNVKQYTVKGPDGYDMMLYPFGKQPAGQSPFFTRDRAVAEKIAAERGGQVIEGNVPLPDKNGKELFAEDLIRTTSARDGNGGWFAAEMLRDAGLPGIRYLDQGSRGAGEGSRNYVVFDDKLIEILRKYGLAGFTAGGAALNEMLSGAQDAPRQSWSNRMLPGDA